MGTTSPLRIAVLSRHALIRMGMTSLLQSGGGVARVVDPMGLNGQVDGVDVTIYDLTAVTESHLVSSRYDAEEDLRHLIRRAPVVGLTRDEREDLDEVAYALGVRVLVSESVSPRGLFDALYTATGRARCP